MMSVPCIACQGGNSAETVGSKLEDRRLTSYEDGLAFISLGFLARKKRERMGV